MAIMKPPNLKRQSDINVLSKWNNVLRRNSEARRRESQPPIAYKETPMRGGRNRVFERVVMKRRNQRIIILRMPGKAVPEE